jgi:hypothetical protein
VLWLRWVSDLTDSVPQVSSLSGMAQGFQKGGLE